MTHYNERRLPRMHTGCVGYVLAVILGATLALYAVIGGALAGVG